MNGAFWVFAASLSNLGFELRVTDLERGTVRSWTSPAGSFMSLADTASFVE